MNDLNQIAPNTSLRLYPDDTTMYTADTSAACSAAVFLIRICNQRYHKLLNGPDWLNLDYLTIKPDKTQALEWQRRTEKIKSLYPIWNYEKAFGKVFMIMPHFQYCAPLLLGIGKGHSKRMEEANFYIIRTLVNLPKSSCYNGIQSLEYRRVLSIMLVV